MENGSMIERYQAGALDTLSRDSKTKKWELFDSITNNSYSFSMNRLKWTVRFTTKSILPCESPHDLAKSMKQERWVWWFYHRRCWLVFSFIKEAMISIFPDEKQKIHFLVYAHIIIVIIAIYGGVAFHWGQRQWDDSINQSMSNVVFHYSQNIHSWNILLPIKLTQYHKIWIAI